MDLNLENICPEELLSSVFAGVDVSLIQVINDEVVIDLRSEKNFTNVNRKVDETEEEEEAVIIPELENNPANRSVEFSETVEEEEVHSSKNIKRKINPNQQALIISQSDIENSSLNQSPEEHETGQEEEIQSFKNNKRRKLNSGHQGLLNFLEKQPDGKAILAHYERRKCLDKDSRCLLSRTILQKFSDDAVGKLAVGEKLENFKIPTNVLMAIAEAIPKIFPGEKSETFFSPYRKEGSVSLKASGKLWEGYNYHKTILRKKNLLQPSNRLSNKCETNCETANTFSGTIDQNINEAHNRLKASVDYELLKDDWKITFEHRRNSLIVDQISVSDYIQTYPCLTVQEGKQLLNDDFKTLKPGKCLLLEERWPIIRTILINQLQGLNKKKIKDVDDLAFIKLLPVLEKSDQQDSVILFLLNLLIPAKNVGRKKKDSTETVPAVKFQPKERRETFFYHVEVISELEKSIKDLQDRLSARKETPQPLIVATGPLGKISKVYVVVNNVKYEVDSCLSALDLAFKIFFVLDCEYPKSSNDLWQFVQRAGYSIKINGEKIEQAVNCLLGLIEKELPTVCNYN